MILYFTNCSIFANTMPCRRGNRKQERNPEISIASVIFISLSNLNCRLNGVTKSDTTGNRATIKEENVPRDRCTSKKFNPLSSFH